MSSSDTLITQVQLALIGVILVTGLFFMWRAVCRIEEKIDSLKATHNGAGVCSYDQVSDEQANAVAQKMMYDVFGGAACDEDTFVYNEDTPVVQMDDNEDDAQPQEIITPEPVEEASEADTNPLSKSKLKKMSIEELKELCRQRQLPTDGAKPVLVDRVLGLTRE